MKVKLTRTEVGDAKIGDTVDLPEGEALGLCGVGAAERVHDGIVDTPDVAPPLHIEATPPNEEPVDTPPGPVACVICLAETDSPVIVDGIGTCCPSCSAPPADAH